jgi:hypothetical protein
VTGRPVAADPAHLIAAVPAIPLPLHAADIPAAQLVLRTGLWWQRHMGSHAVKGCGRELYMSAAAYTSALVVKTANPEQALRASPALYQLVASALHLCLVTAPDRDKSELAVGHCLS